MKNLIQTPERLANLISGLVAIALVAAVFLTNYLLNA